MTRRFTINIYDDDGIGHYNRFVFTEDNVERVCDRMLEMVDDPEYGFTQDHLEMAGYVLASLFGED